MIADNSNIISTVAVLLKTQVLGPEGLTANKLAERCMLSNVTINEILKGKPLTGELALKLEQGTGIPVTTWLFLNDQDNEDDFLIFT